MWIFGRLESRGKLSSWRKRKRRLYRLKRVFLEEFIKRGKRERFECEWAGEWAILGEKGVKRK